jgi:hypothetical protein
MRDLHNNINAIRCVSPVAIGTTGTGKTGKPVDLAGFEGAEIVLDYGAITATNAVFTPVIFEGDVTGSMTSVADADLIGTEAAAGVGATGTRTSGVSKNVTKRVGYKGAKRYVNAKLSSTVTAGTPIAVTVLRGHAHSKPVA